MRLGSQQKTDQRQQFAAFEGDYRQRGGAQGHLRATLGPHSLALHDSNGSTFIAADEAVHHLPGAPSSSNSVTQQAAVGPDAIEWVTTRTQDFGLLEGVIRGKPATQTVTTERLEHTATGMRRVTTTQQRQRRFGVGDFYDVGQPKRVATEYVRLGG